jgi:type III pantothenate kinase
MKLMLDIGNTRIKWALLEDSKLGEQQALMHTAVSDQQLREQLFAQIALIHGQPPTAVHVSNVAGDAMADRIRRLVYEHWRLDAQFVVSGTQATVRGRVIRNAYPEPRKLGVDRWLALLGATQPDHPALVVSVGTAMTIDALAADGQHLGGLIVPGPQLMVNALFKNTSDIAERAAAGEVAEDYFADNTLGCVTRGAQHACAALIADAHAQLAHHGEVTLWLTGGAVNAVQAELRMPYFYAPDLVLRGLATQV